MTKKTFTSKLPMSNKVAVIEKVEAYIPKDYRLEYNHFDAEDVLVVDIYHEYKGYAAELQFSDKGVEIVDQQDKDLEIPLNSIETIWVGELEENYGKAYVNSINQTTFNI